ncbi:MAG TPA: hypothetical protein DDW52_24520 [Planctomycetaceae bacterium]|nr:hypothetical protein [Planctomycetaceae bacterium]
MKIHSATCIAGIATLCIIGSHASLALGQTKDSPNHSKHQNKVVHQFSIPARQGVAVDRNYLYAISNTEIVKCEKLTGEVVTSWVADANTPRHGHILHLNSGTVVGTQLFCAHSRYPIAPNDNTVELWDVEDRKLEHIASLNIPGKYGSLTWIDQHRNGSWWMCFARYGRPENEKTTLVHYKFEQPAMHKGLPQFIEIESWNFPEEVIQHWGTKSCSGGSWGPDGLLYTTGHDDSTAFVLSIDEPIQDDSGGVAASPNRPSRLRLARTETGMGFFGQAIAWDRSAQDPILWGIVKRKNVSATLIPAAAVKPSGSEND